MPHSLLVLCVCLIARFSFCLEVTPFLFSSVVAMEGAGCSESYVLSIWLKVSTF